MKIHNRNLIAATGLLSLLLAVDAQAQPLIPFGPANYEHDFQFFAPVELDLDNDPYVDDYGYYFNYDKLLWSYSGERVQVGDPDVVVLSEEIYRINPQDELNPLFADGRPDPYLVRNGLQDVTPDAGFAGGNRYQFGYRDRGNGWLIGILDGPELNQGQVHGIGQNTPFIDPDYTDGSDDPATVGSTIAGGDLRAFGFGSVHVNFATPPGFLFGFRDYLDTLGEAAIGTQGGPILYVGNYGMNSATDSPDANNNMLQYTFFRLTDDLDGDSAFGAYIILDPTRPNGYIIVHDYDDLHQFNVAFDLVTIRNTTETRGVEAMWTHELTNRHYMAKNQNNHLELAFGARFLRLYDRFAFEGLGSILGRTTFETSMTNQIVGPQVGAKWTNQRQRWRTTADARFMFGFNVQDWDQFGGIGEELIPGALNRPLFAQPTYFNRGLQKDNFSPVGELRLETSYYFTQSVSLKLGYTGMFVGHIRRAATSVKYALPDLGYREAGTQDLLVNGFNLGVEFVH